MSDGISLDVQLLPWQTEVFNDPTRFKVVAAGRRTGKSRLAIWTLLINALQATKGHVFYVAPTQGQARDILWNDLLELGQDVITSSHINNLQVKLINGATISLKGADRPETMRGVSLKYLVMDEYADMKPEVFEQILRPALTDQKGGALFIGTPMGRNHFYEMFINGQSEEDKSFQSWHFTSYDNPLLDPEEIDIAKTNMSSYSFRQEYMASFEAGGSEMFKEDWIVMNDKEPEHGDYYIAIDLAGFEDNTNKLKNKRLDETAISIVKVSPHGWWVKKIIHGRWDLNTTAMKIFQAVKEYRPMAVGIEKGIAKQAVISPLTDLMKQHQRFFQVQELTHGNQKKTDRIMWALQGRFENGRIELNKGEWNIPFMDQLFQFPNKLVHDDLIDSLSYIDQLAVISYNVDFEEEDYDCLDSVSGY
jgi:phage terminase large subunit-like protein